MIISIQYLAKWAFTIENQTPPCWKQPYFLVSWKIPEVKADDQSSSITKGSIYCIKIMYTQPFSMEVDWAEIWCLMEACIYYVLYCRYCIFTLWGRIYRLLYCYKLKGCYSVRNVCKNCCLLAIRTPDGHVKHGHNMVANCTLIPVSHFFTENYHLMVPCVFTLWLLLGVMI